jgi:hypothetical protein
VNHRMIVALGVVLPLLVTAAAPAFADNAFYIELGKDTDQKNVQKDWQYLASKYKPQLKGLQLFPKSIIQAGAPVGVRIQAGPIDSKTRAQQICSKLFAKHVSCFVIEGVDGKPPTEVMNLSERAEQKPVEVVQLPWANNAEVAPEQPVESPEDHVLRDSNGHSVVSWLDKDTSGDTQTVPPEQHVTETPLPPQGKAEVEVSQAIRVPLTQNESQQHTPRLAMKPLIERKPFQIQQVARAPLDAPAATSAGWITVGSFPNDEVAMSFWEEVRSAARTSAANLHARVIQPMMLSQSNAKTMLGIGPFAGNDAAAAFCRDNIQADERGLSCDYSNTPAPDRRTAPENNAPQYWIELPAAGSQEEAISQWQQIQDDNKDILGGKRGTVSANPESTSVRIGPFNANRDAAALCARLQEREIGCEVLSSAKP